MLPSELHDESLLPGSLTAAGGDEPVLAALEREQRWDDLVTRLIEHAEAGADPGERARWLVRAAVVFETRLDDPDRALYTLQAAFREDFADEAVALQLGRLATGLDRWPAVLAECEALLPTLPGERQQVDLLLAIANFHDRHLNDAAAAERVLARVLAVDPCQPAAVRALVDMASRRQDWAGAVQRLAAAAQVARSAPDEARLRLEAASLLETRMGDRDAAAEHYRRVLALSPGHIVASEAMARLAPGAVSPPPLTPFPRAPSASEPEPEPESAREREPQSEPAGELAAASRLAFEQRRWAESRTLGARALARQGLTRAERAEIAERVGRACLALGDPEDAIRMLGPVVEALPDHRGCRETILQACEDAGDDVGAARHRQALLPLLDSDPERYEILVRAARRTRDVRHDPVTALKLYGQALALRSDDHDTLHEALELHSAAGDWKGAVQVLERLADLESGRPRARYLVASANILNYNLNAADQAVELYNRALDDDPDDLKTFERIERILTAKRAWRDEARNFRRMIRRLGPNPPPENRALVLMLWKGLGETCRSRLKDLPAAAAAFEVCATLDPSDLSSQEILAEILERQGPAEAPRALEKRALLLAAAESPPDLVRHIQAMLRLHGARQQHDRIWCACAALVALGAADGRQRGLYERMVDQPPRVPRGGLNEEMWQRGVYHASEDRRLSQLFATVGSSVAMLRAKEARAWGLTERKRAAAEGSVIGRILTYASALLGVGAPHLYVLPDRPGQIDLANVVDHQRLAPAFVAGADILRARPERETAFIVGRALALLRFEHLVLWPHVVASTAELRAVLTAVLKMFLPDFVVPSAEQVAVKQYLAILERTLPPHALEPLMALVPTLTDRAPAADVDSWARAALFTANRAGLLACGDIVTAAQMAATQAPAQGMTADEAVTDLVRWSVSPEHLAIREQLGLSFER
jgi:golgin subfamily B member 1